METVTLTGFSGVVYSATHVATRLHPGSEADRKREEADLIARYNPPMNEQHRTGTTGAPASPGRYAKYLKKK